MRLNRLFFGMLSTLAVEIITAVANTPSFWLRTLGVTAAMVIFAGAAAQIQHKE